MAEQDQISFQRGDDTTLLVRFSGAWRLRGGLPSASLVDRELQSAAQVRGVAFETKELISWDSSVLAFLVELSELCRQRGINMDRAGLPAGVRRLLHLAEAVPEKKGARFARLDCRCGRSPSRCRVDQAIDQGWFPRSQSIGESLREPSSLFETTVIKRTSHI